ncbi:hypothetical protein EJ07DRAFT_165292 [Lizonia empirigonia]|nr:hypothetical protein EJ07DRAFT_165292 [Lizonia empirigonia]
MVDAKPESGVRGLDQAGTTTLSRNFADDIISKGLIATEEALTLLSIFQQHYGRWVSFGPLLSTPILLEDMRKSPLLLAACCLIAVRHTSQELAAQLAPVLLDESETLLSLAILSTPQPIEFLQAALILSMWSTTIGQIPMSVDSWLLSSFALQHSIASGTLSPSLNEVSSRSSRSVSDRLCIWNHLCLVHLHYCVGTRRKAMLDRNDIEQCRHILVNETSNFESCMVAEWKFLFDQPRSQFIQMGYHFAQLLTYDRSLKIRSAAVRETLLIEMVRLSTTIMKLAMDTADERTRHLTDHIYHMLSFAAFTLSRLLHKYEEQLAATHDLLELDRLVLSLAAWLHAIGLPCHIAHTMGSVVAAFHAKLRPEIESASYIDVDPAIQDDFARFFPELFGDSPISSMQISMLPEFQSIP